MSSPAPQIVLDTERGLTEADIHALAEHGPVVRLSVMGLDVWAVTGYEELRTLMADPEVKRGVEHWTAVAQGKVPAEHPLVKLAAEGKGFNG